MVPIPGLESVRCAWIAIQGEGFELHGFLVYSASDHYFPEYIADDGMVDLNLWSTSRCAVYVVHSPSEQWIEYAKATGHLWWKIFGSEIGASEEELEVLRELGDTPLLQIGEEKKTMQQVFAPCLNTFLHGEEIRKILQWFNLRETQHPCMILFRDLYDRSVWYIDLRDLVGLRKKHLRESLRDWFDTGDFMRILAEAHRA